MAFPPAAPLLWVEWLDSSSSGTWVDRETALRRANETQMICRSVGWVLKDDDQSLVLYAGMNDVDDVLGVIEIPARCVLSRRELRKR